MRTVFRLAVVGFLMGTLVFAGEMKLEVGKEIVVEGKGKHSQWAPAAAFDGKGTYLVVWSDGTGSWGGDADIHAVRVSSDGRVMDASPIIVSKAKDFQKHPCAAWTGREWLVVWQDMRNGKDYDLYAARVSSAGKVLDPSGVAVCAEPGDQVFPAVAADGKGGSLAVWADFRGGNYDIYGAPIGGGKADPPSALIAVREDQMGPSVAWAGGHYLVACANQARNWRKKELTTLLLVRVGPHGKLLDKMPRGHGFGIAGFDSAMAAGGGHALLLGNTHSGKLYNPNGVFGVFLDANGVALKHDNPGRKMFSVPMNRIQNPSPITLCSTGSRGAWDVFHPAVAASGGWFLALHQEASGGHKAGKDYRVFIRHQLINAKTGRVVEDGRITPRGAREKRPSICGGSAGSFLVLYERNNASEPNQRVCARVVKAR